MSADVKLVKPDPEIFNVFLKKSQFDPEHTMFVDDEVHNGEGAKKANIKYVYINGVGLI